MGPSSTMSLFDLQDVCVAIESLATLDLPMIVASIGIFELKGPYYMLTMTNCSPSLSLALLLPPPRRLHRNSFRPNRHGDSVLRTFAGFVVQTSKGIEISVMDRIERSSAIQPLKGCFPRGMKAPSRWSSRAFKFIKHLLCPGSGIQIRRCVNSDIRASGSDLSIHKILPNCIKFSIFQKKRRIQPCSHRAHVVQVSCVSVAHRRHTVPHVVHLLRTYHGAYHAVGAHVSNARFGRRCAPVVHAPCVPPVIARRARGCTHPLFYLCALAVQQEATRVFMGMRTTCNMRAEAGAPSLGLSGGEIGLGHDACRSQCFVVEDSPFVLLRGYPMLSEEIIVWKISNQSPRCVLDKWVYLVAHAMSLFDLQDVCMSIESLAIIDLPMTIDSIGIFELKKDRTEEEGWKCDFLKLAGSHPLSLALLLSPPRRRRRNSFQPSRHGDSVRRTFAGLVQTSKGIEISVVDQIVRSSAVQPLKGHFPRGLVGARRLVAREALLSSCQLSPPRGLFSFRGGPSPTSAARIGVILDDAFQLVIQMSALRGGVIVISVKITKLVGLRISPSPVAPQGRCNIFHS
ncbi:hypothetical protein F511_37681 [Dorcoceras hygrometricum]|uniref:Uncharacterized protein n=1 Tax=Dorcoceras hygrometricum TaxID=472368 RepID=A0A2Z7D3U0_9LAMI|nr:hypothetical protein F511_37681 [Dorcoceras hygrometricum]